MRELIVRDDGQVRRIDAAIATFKALPVEQQQRCCLLLQALQSERAEITRYKRRGRTPRLVVREAA